MDSVAMKKAQQILSTVTDDELHGFISMFGQKGNIFTESQEKRRERELAAAERITERRVVLPADFDERREMMEYLDERSSLWVRF